jgi:hypothetical protein
VAAVPNVILAGYQGTGGTAGNTGANRSIQLMDTLTWTKGKHTIKTGADYRYLTALYTCSFCSRQLGKYVFNGSVTSALLSNGVVTPYEPFAGNRWRRLGREDRRLRRTSHNPTRDRRRAGEVCPMG